MSDAKTSSEVTTDEIATLLIPSTTSSLPDPTPQEAMALIVKLQRELCLAQKRVVELEEKFGQNLPAAHHAKAIKHAMRKAVRQDSRS